MPEAGAPAPAPPPAPSTGVSVAGQVTDAAWRPLSGARIEVANGPDAGKFIVTDGSGEYRLSGRFDESTQFRASKSGHADATMQLPPECAQCNPHWWIYFALESLAPHADLSGRYELTFTAAESCSGLPEELRRRTYDATLTPYQGSGAAANSQFTVDVAAPALPLLNSFLIGVAGNYLAFWLGDLHGAPGLAEQLAPNVYIGIGGAGEASVATSGLSSISARFDGFIDACEINAPSQRLSCRDEATVMKSRCESGEHRITLTRR
jgi:hypothetical protein